MWCQHGCHSGKEQEVYNAVRTTHCATETIDTLRIFFHSFFLHFFFENEGFSLLPFETLPFVSLCHSSFFLPLFFFTIKIFLLICSGFWSSSLHFSSNIRLLFLFFHFVLFVFFSFLLFFFFSNTCFSCSIFHLVQKIFVFYSFLIFSPFTSTASPVWCFSTFFEPKNRSY